MNFTYHTADPITGAPETLDLTVRQSTYPNGGLAIYLTSDGTDRPYAVVSVNMPPYNVPLPAGAFFLKEWSDGSDISRAFIESGLIEPAEDVKPRTSGFVSARAYRLKEGAP